MCLGISNLWIKIVSQTWTNTVLVIKNNNHLFLFFPSVASEPRKLYEMPKCSKSEKIEDALLWECPVVRFVFRAFVYKAVLA